MKSSYGGDYALDFMRQTMRFITATRVKWEDIAWLVENGWEIDIYSDKLGEAIMSTIGYAELDENGKPVNLEPKRGEAYVEKPRPQQPAPPMHRK